VNGSTTWRLLDPYARDVFTARSLNADIDVQTLQFDGDYTLLIEGQVGQTNATPYRFTVYPVPNTAPIPIDLEGRPGPDLQVIDALVSATGPLQSGALVTVTWKDTNTGNRDTESSWSDRLIVRNAPNQIIATPPLVPYDLGPLAPGASVTRTATVQLPDGPSAAGILSFSITTDINNEVAEQDELDNTQTVTVASALAPYPDLVASGLTIDPPAAWSPGSTVTVHWRVDNAGTRAPGQTWSETVQVRNLSTSQTVYAQTFAHAAGSDGATLAMVKVRQIRPNSINPASAARRSR